MVQYRDTTLENETIELNSKDVHFLGPSLNLVNCNILINARSKNFIIRDVHIIGGRFERLGGFTDIQFDGVQFENVKFVGYFSGIDFGWWDKSEPGWIKNCDFTEATFQACRFLSTDMATIKLPHWPHFSIPDPKRLAAWVKERKWPDNLDVILEVATDVEPGCSAAVDNAQILADADGISLAEMRELLAAIPGIEIID
jgi:hypothetical protein